MEYLLIYLAFLNGRGREGISRQDKENFMMVKLLIIKNNHQQLQNKIKLERERERDMKKKNR